LVGKWFHSLKKDPRYPRCVNGIVEWQGQIIGKPEPGWYLIQLYEWFMGSQTDQRLVPFAEMAGWLFYESDESMRYSSEYGSARAGGPYRPSDRELQEKGAVEATKGVPS
jgi:hypothetical protein